MHIDDLPPQVASLCRMANAYADAVEQHKKPYVPLSEMYGERYPEAVRVIDGMIAGVEKCISGIEALYGEWNSRVDIPRLAADKRRLQAFKDLATLLAKRHIEYNLAKKLAA